MVGKMNDESPAGKDAGLAKLRDGAAQQRFRDQGSESRVNTRFVEPKQLRVRAVMSVEHFDDLVAQRFPMISVQGNLRVPVMADLGRVDRNERLAFRRRQITGLYEGIEVESTRRCRKHAGEGRRSVGCPKRIKPRQAQCAVL